jgi:transcriptional regulator with XRE-family HTH domain
MKHHFGAVAELIRSYRNLSPYSQTELSILIGYKNGQFISNVERALCSIPLKKLGPVCKVLNIPHEEMKRALVIDYMADIDDGLLYGDTDDDEHEVLPVHSNPAADREGARSTLS